MLLKKINCIKKGSRDTRLFVWFACNLTKRGTQNRHVSPRALVMFTFMYVRSNIRYFVALANSLSGAADCAGRRRLNSLPE